MQLNWSSVLLDGYKKLSIPRQWSCEDRRVKTIDSTVRLHRAATPAKDISIAFYFSSFLLLVCMYGLYACTHVVVFWCLA